MICTESDDRTFSSGVLFHLLRMADRMADKSTFKSHINISAQKITHQPIGTKLHINISTNRHKIAHQHIGTKSPTNRDKIAHQHINKSAQNYQQIETKLHINRSTNRHKIAHQHIGTNLPTNRDKSGHLHRFHRTDPMC